MDILVNQKKKINITTKALFTEQGESLSQDTKKAPPKVCVIIPNWNGKKHLEKCLQSLRDQTYTNYEIMIVDNGSTDNSVSYLQKNFPEVIILKLDRNVGYSVAINTGLIHSDSKYVVALNNDTIVQPEWLSELIIVAESNGQIGSCQSKILSLSNPSVIDAVGLSVDNRGNPKQEGYLSKDKGQYNKIREVFGACSAAVIYRRQALIQVGLFDRDFFAYCEDIDIAVRLRIAGWKCMYVPKAIVYHIGSATGRDKSPFKTYLLQRNNYFYRVKNFSINAILKYLLEKPLTITLTITRYCISGESHLIIPSLKGDLHGIKNYQKMYKKRHNTYLEFTQLINDNA